MEKIIIVGHGSPKEDANKLADLTKALAITLKKQPEDIKYAYIKFGSPSIEESIIECIKENAKTIIIHPLFLFSGSHVSYDIPEIIKKFRKNYPYIEIICTKPLGLHEKLLEIIKKRIDEIKQEAPKNKAN
ncbi:Sirohydrochlorin cobaltochelatase [Thermodesulfovibrio sp. N1]|nr:Sirohydrochlorin cobaltochelatase [Thermodesulfovibrio sp. N1]